MIPEDILDLASSAAEQAEVVLVESQETPVSFEANRLKLLQTRQSRAVGVRLVKEGRIGIASATSLDHAEELVAAALEVAPFGAEAKFQLPELRPANPVDIYDPATEGVTIEAMVELGQRLIDAVRAQYPDLLCEAGVTKSAVTFRLLNSKGGRVEYKKSVFAIGLEGQLVRGTDLLFVGDGESSCRPDVDAQRVIAETLRQLELAQETARIPSGEYPVLFTPRGVRSALVAPLAMAFNGKVVLQGASPLGGRLGQRLFDPCLQVWDDATLPYRPASRAWDDEGIPTRHTPLIDQGVVSNFLYDLQTAGLAGTQSTGHASRAPGSQPSPALHALIIGEGDASFEEMVAEMRAGLVVEQLMGASQGNILGGDFSGNVLLGYKVEGGRLVGRVKDTMVSGNVFQALREGVGIGKEGRWVGGGLYTPPLLFPKLALSSKNGG